MSSSAQTALTVKNVSSDIHTPVISAADVSSRWLSAHEYFKLLVEAGTGEFPLYELGEDQRNVPIQPDFIYTEPRSCIYFLRCTSLLGAGSIGFPRKRAHSGSSSVHKRFIWRKMSFVTKLPLSKPLIRYITASCVLRTDEKDRKSQDVTIRDIEQQSQKLYKKYRAHAIMQCHPTDPSKEVGPYVLMHIRDGDRKNVGVRVTSKRVLPSDASTQQVEIPLESHRTPSPYQETTKDQQISLPSLRQELYSSQAPSGGTSFHEQQLNNNDVLSLDGAQYEWHQHHGSYNVPTGNRMSFQQIAHLPSNLQNSDYTLTSEETWSREPTRRQETYAHYNSQRHRHPSSHFQRGDLRQEGYLSSQLSGNAPHLWQNTNSWQRTVQEWNRSSASTHTIREDVRNLLLRYSPNRSTLEANINVAGDELQRLHAEYVDKSTHH